MAEAYRCDRCKQFYEAFDTNLNPTDDRTYDYYIRIIKRNRYRNDDKAYDLCPTCYKALSNFLFSYEQ